MYAHNHANVRKSPQFCLAFRTQYSALINRPAGRRDNACSANIYTISDGIGEGSFIPQSRHVPKTDEQLVEEGSLSSNRHVQEYKVYFTQQGIF